MVKVLSGNVDSVQECEELRARVGDDPRVWLPLFCGWKQSSREAAHAA
jgi:type IV secretion system protein VirB4